MGSNSEESVAILTVGHSTHPLEEFIRLLKDNGVTLVADVRSVLRSRHNPQFNRETLPLALNEARIGYIHFPELGGWRRPRSDSVNLGWHSPGFRGYADYLDTQEFALNLAALASLARRNRVAVMCAEAAPYRCHRSLIADALTVQGFRVEHILSSGQRRPHRLTPFARVENGRLTYPAL